MGRSYWGAQLGRLPPPRISNCARVCEGSRTVQCALVPIPCDTRAAGPKKSKTAHDLNPRCHTRDLRPRRVTAVHVQQQCSGAPPASPRPRSLSRTDARRPLPGLATSADETSS
eukprot:1391386-Prymnesium_polylepis.2